MSNPVTPATAPPPVAGTLDEFSDKLSPMLVKELRQGLRAKTFVILFLALQGLLAIVLLTAVGAGASERAGLRVSTTIFFFFSLAALVAQPLRGIGALHNEIKGNTIDLMVLTRLGAWRIVLGKWVAIVSQTALLLTAIAPYLILRYFFGQMNLFAELLMLVLVFLGSAVFTALTVGLSAIPSILIRGLLPLGVAFGIGSGIFSITFDGDLKDLIEFCTLQENGAGWVLLTGIGIGAYFAWSALALGASMIAPMAENHSTVRRLVALGTILLLGALVWFARFPQEATILLLVLICIPAISIALTEPLQLMPPICRPFLRFGTAGRVAGRFFYPGWPSGTFFTGLLVATAFGVLASQAGSGSLLRPYSHEPSVYVMIFAGLGTLLMPALILRIFGAKVRQTFAFYLLIVVLLIVIAIAVTLIAEEARDGGPNDGDFMWWFSWIPTVQASLAEHVWHQHFRSASASGIGQPNFAPLITVGITTCSVYFLALIVSAVRKFPAIREVEMEAASKPAIDP